MDYVDHAADNQHSCIKLYIIGFFCALLLYFVDLCRAKVAARSAASSQAVVPPRARKNRWDAGAGAVPGVGSELGGVMGNSLAASSDGGTAAMTSEPGLGKRSRGFNEGKYCLFKILIFMVME